jgi:hypothetical protein
LDIVYVPAQIQPAPPAADPRREELLSGHRDGPGGQARRTPARPLGEEICWRCCVRIRGRAGSAVLTHGRALVVGCGYTVTFTPESEPHVLVPDEQGVCRFSGMAGNYRMVSNGWGLCRSVLDTMALYCGLPPERFLQNPLDKREKMYTISGLNETFA